MPTAKRRRVALSPNAAQTRIARAFMAYLARRPTNATTQNAIPGRRRLQLGAHAHDASSIAELMRRANWRDPLTRTPLTNAQAAAAWRLHVRNEGAEARRAGRQYAAPAMPQRPVGNFGGARVSEILQWYHGNQPAPQPRARATAHRRLDSVLRGAQPRHGELDTVKEALKRAWAAVLTTDSNYTGRHYTLSYAPGTGEYNFSKDGVLIAKVSLTGVTLSVTVSPVRQLDQWWDWVEWKQEMSQTLTTMLRNSGR